MSTAAERKLAVAQACCAQHSCFDCHLLAAACAFEEEGEADQV
jgi:hypothetical protein